MGMRYSEESNRIPFMHLSFVLSADDVKHLRENKAKRPGWPLYDHLSTCCVTTCKMCNFFLKRAQKVLLFFFLFFLHLVLADIRTLIIWFVIIQVKNVSKTKTGLRFDVAKYHKLARILFTVFCWYAICIIWGRLVPGETVRYSAIGSCLITWPS